MLRLIALPWVLAHKNMMHLQRRDRNRLLEILLPLENKQQIMQNNVETQHKHILVDFPMVRFACIVTSQVFVKSLMQWSMAFSPAFYRGRENIYE